jgi:hypothetical protein
MLEALEDRMAPAIVNTPSVVAGIGTGSSEVRVFGAATGTQTYNFLAYQPGFTSGVRIAVGDINGDAVADIITVPAPGSRPQVRVYSGVDQALLADFLAFSSRFRGGLFVTTGNFDGDTSLEVAVGTGRGVRARVRTFDITGGTGLQILGPLGNFLPYGRGFNGGVVVAAGNFDGAAGDELITAPNSGAGPRVRVFTSTGTMLTSFLAYGRRFKRGVFLATGDVNGDGQVEIVTGTNQGGGPVIGIFNGGTGSRILTFLAFEASFRGGVRVATVDADGDMRADIIAGRGPGSGPQVLIFDGQTIAQLQSFFAFPQTVSVGVYVAGG